MYVVDTIQFNSKIKHLSTVDIKNIWILFSLCSDRKAKLYQ